MRKDASPPQAGTHSTAGTPGLGRASRLGHKMETPHGSSVCCFFVLGLLSRWFFIFLFSSLSPLFPFTTEKKTKKQKKRRPLSQGDRHQPYFFTSRKIPPPLSSFYLLFFFFSTGKKHTNTPLSLAATLYMILNPILSVKLGTGGKVVSLPLRVHVFLYFLGAASGQLGIAGAGYADTKNKKKRLNFMINFHIFTISSLYDRRKEKNIKYSKIGPSCSCSFSRSCWGRGRGEREGNEAPIATANYSGSRWATIGGGTNNGMQEAVLPRGDWIGYMRAGSSIDHRAHPIRPTTSSFFRHPTLRGHLSDTPEPRASPISEIPTRSPDTAPYQ
ncbi:hypothetical protein LZ32DRAFT_126597 [Colletotrichum eremochloae]|nr:hypothetical protein LZ32DRAFT_126597 [Colletotrichum eremochloae]